ncbi:transporter [Nesidiocoris tenuis]|uniref:Transporter n=1 Tax=Nesidiocoris tenuis TaxID=355587 RepID=A0ABN7B5I9_9HEMI|nr:transporter [Nesidiocoris tenuis]
MVAERVLRQWIATITCSISVSMVASCFVWPAPLMPVPESGKQFNWILNSIPMPVGAFVFSLPAGWLADKFGRRSVLLQACPLVLISWIIVVAMEGIVALLIVRVIQGFAMAIVYVVGPAYLAEISESHKRGLLTGQFQTMYLLGVVYAYTMGSLLGYTSYAFTQMIFPIVAIIAFYMMPESPYFLLMAGKPASAVDALQWLRGSDEIIDEYNMIKESVERDMLKRRGFRDLIRTIEDQRSLAIAVWMCILRSLSGMSPLSIFLIDMLSKDAKGIFASQPMAINLMVITLAFTLAFSFIVDSVGRKPVLIFATVGSTTFAAMLTIYYGLETTVDSHSWIMYCAMVGFSISHNVGLGGLMQTIQAEYFPCRTRALAGSIITMLHAVLTLISIALFIYWKESIGNSSNFGLYTVISLTGVGVLPVAIHETTGRTLAQIEEVGICRKKSRKIMATSTFNGQTVVPDVISDIQHI